MTLLSLIFDLMVKDLLLVPVYPFLSIPTAVTVAIPALTLSEYSSL